MHRPYLLETYNCTDVSVVGISLSNSPFWTVHPYVSSRIELRGLSIYAPVGSPNTDGIDPDSSSYVTIADTTIENGEGGWGGGGGGGGDAWKLRASTDNRSLVSRTMLQVTIALQSSLDEDPRGLPLLKQATILQSRI